MTEQEALTIMSTLLDGFRPTNWSVGSTRVYVKSITDLDYDAARVAAARLLQTGQFMPRIADLRAEVQKVAHPERITAGEAWALVLREVARVGTLGKPEFKDPTVAAAVKAVGWRGICQSEMPGVERAHFTKAYDALLARAVEQGQLSDLVKAAGEAIQGASKRALEEAT